MKISPFTPPDVRETLLHEISHQFELPIVPFNERRLFIADVGFQIKSGNAIPVNPVVERILSPFSATPSNKPDYIVNPTFMGEPLQIPPNTPGNVMGTMSPTDWQFITYQWSLTWNSRQPACIDVRHHLSMIHIINALRPFLAHQMLLMQAGLLLHASAAIHEGRTVVFLGHSGAGKSTCARLTPGQALSDETIAVKFDSNKGILIFGTPFGGELFPNGSPGTSPRFLFVKKSHRNGLNPIPLRNALPRLLSQTVLYPFAPGLYWETATDLCLQLLKDCPVEELEAKPDGSFWKECLS